MRWFRIHPILRIVTVAVAMASAERAPAQTQDCTPYYQQGALSLSLWVRDISDMPVVMNWPGISLARSAEHADLIWNRESGDVFDSRGRLLATGVEDGCPLASLVSQRRATAYFQQLGGGGQVQLLTTPTVDGHAYEGEKIGLVVSLRIWATQAYVTIFDVQANGLVSFLFPLETDGDGLVKHGQLIKLADARVTQPFGADQIVAITTDRPALDLRDRLFRAVGSSARRIIGGRPGSHIIGNGNDNGSHSLSNSDAVTDVLNAIRQTESAYDDFNLGTTTLYTEAQPPPRPILRDMERDHASTTRSAPSIFSRLDPTATDLRFTVARDHHYRINTSFRVALLDQHPSRLVVSEYGLPAPYSAFPTAAAPTVFHLRQSVASINSTPAGSRLALVIGNSDYSGANVLPNSKNDARDIASALQQNGYNLVGGAPQVNLSIAQMQAVLRTTYSQASAVDSLLVFYAGHGVQRLDHNYLIPVDAKLDAEGDLDLQAIKLEDVFHAVEPAKRIVIILDACRTSAFSLKDKSGQRRGLYVRGLAPEFQPRSLVAYSTLPGHTASDGSGAHSPYAEALLKHIREPHKTARQVLQEIYSDFSNSLGDAHIADEDTQLPVFEDLMGTDEFYF